MNGGGVFPHPRFNSINVVGNGADNRKQEHILMDNDEDKRVLWLVTRATVSVCIHKIVMRWIW